MYRQDINYHVNLIIVTYEKSTISQISHICVWIVDQNGYPVNLREDDFVVTLTLHLRRRVTPVSLEKE